MITMNKAGLEAALREYQAPGAPFMLEHVELIVMAYLKAAGDEPSAGTVEGVGWLTQDDVVGALSRHVEEHGSQKAVAALAGVSESFLSHVMNGRRAPTGPLLDWLGLREEVRYVFR